MAYNGNSPLTPPIVRTLENLRGVIVTLRDDFKETAQRREVIGENKNEMAANLALALRHCEDAEARIVRALSHHGSTDGVFSR